MIHNKNYTDYKMFSAKIPHPAISSTKTVMKQNCTGMLSQHKQLLEMETAFSISPAMSAIC